jgi:hypothetical protein
VAPGATVGDPVGCSVDGVGVPVGAEVERVVRLCRRRCAACQAVSDRRYTLRTLLSPGMSSSG